MPSPRLKRITLVLFSGLLIAACGEIASGDLVTEDRNVGSFDNLDIRDGVNVELTVDSGAETSVSVTYDDNIIDNVVTQVSGDTLLIEFDGSVTSFGGSGRTVDVVVASIDRIEISGGADLEASGAIDRYELDASGGADADLSDLEALTVEVDVSGGADAVVRASDLVEGDASGGADLRIQGSPGSVAVNTSGGADLDIDD